MTTMHWWRCMHGAPFDPKWRVVALAAKSEPGKVWAVVSALYDRASQSKDRGDVAGAGLDEIAEGFGWPVEEIQRIYSALKSKAVIIDNRIASWEKHQPKRERPSDSSAERTRRYRERLKAASHGVTSVTTGPQKTDVTRDVTVTSPTVTVTDVTTVTVGAPSRPPAEPHLTANNLNGSDAMVTPRDAQRRVSSCSSIDSQSLGELQLVCLDSKPPTRPGSKPISSKRDQGTRWTLEAVPESWIIDALKAYPIVDVRHEAVAFVNHWISAPGSKGLKLNWRATWLGWIGREAKRLKEKSHGRYAGQSRNYRNGSDHPLGGFAQIGAELDEVPAANGFADYSPAAH